MTTVTKFAFGVVNSTYTKGAVCTCYSNGTAKTKVLTAITLGSANENLGGDPRVLALHKNLTVSGSTCYAGTIVSNYTYTIGERGAAVFGLYDGLTFGPPKKTAISDNKTGFSSPNVWNVTNPYSVVMGTNCFYLNDYDMAQATTRRNSVYQMNAAPFTQKRKYYTAPAVTNYPKCSCVALNEYDGKLLALFIYYTASLSYANSKLVLLPKNESGTSAVSALTTASCGKNASTITVSGDYVYVTSFGGKQNPGGNTTSKIEVFKITFNSSTNKYSFTNKKTITTSMLPLPLPPPNKSYGQTGNFMGVEVVTGSNNQKYAVILLAKYDSGYTKYEYELVRVLESNLRAGKLDNPNIKYESDVNPAGATWGLIKDSATGELFMAIGKGISKINASTSTIGVTAVTTANEYTIETGHTGYVLNTAVYNAHVAVAKGAAERAAAVPAPGVINVIRPHLTVEEIKELRKESDAE